MPSLLQRGESKIGRHGEACRYPDEESTRNPVRVLCAGHLYHALSRPLLRMYRHSEDHLPSERSQRHILFCGLQETDAQGPSASDIPSGPSPDTRKQNMYYPPLTASVHGRAAVLPSSCFLFLGRGGMGICRQATNGHEPGRQQTAPNSWAVRSLGRHIFELSPCSRGRQTGPG